MSIRSLKTPFLVALMLSLALGLAGCGSKKKPTPVVSGPEIRDLRVIPQDLTALLDRNKDTPILSNEAKAMSYSRYREKFFSSWHMSSPSASKSEVAGLLNRKARGWKNGTTRWQPEEWAAMRDNAGLDSWPNASVPGICIRATDLREMPTHEAKYSKPTPNPRANPFDDFQYSLLHVGTPVLLCHKSEDGKWYYVETAIASGWVDANDLATVTPEFMASWERANMACITKEHVKLGTTGRMADIGAVLPIMAGDENGMTVMVPGRDENRQAKALFADLAPGEASRMPLSMTPRSVAQIGNAMMRQKYGWGGMLGLRDCSATTRDLMAPYGIWLPRNSRAQGRSGEQISLSGLSPREKEQVILQQGVPLASIVVMPGHVVLYAGTWKGRPVIFHNLWGVRVLGPQGQDERVVIGRSIVTSIQPGLELPNIPNGQTIGNRFHTLTILGGAEKR